MTPTTKRLIVDRLIELPIWPFLSHLFIRNTFLHIEYFVSTLFGSLSSGGLSAVALTLALYATVHTSTISLTWLLGFSAAQDRAARRKGTLTSTRMFGFGVFMALVAALNTAVCFGCAIAAITTGGTGGKGKGKADDGDAGEGAGGFEEHLVVYVRNAMLCFSSICVALYLVVTFVARNSSGGGLATPTTKS